MEFNTLEDVQNAFPDEESARKYFHELRWGKFAVCPYCNNAKSYFIENGKRLKCADKKCHKKFSVTVKTILEATKFPLHTLFGMMFMFTKSRGRCSSYDIVSEFKIAPKNEFFIREKIEFAWKFVDRDKKTNKELFDDLLSRMVTGYPAFHDFKHSDFYYSPHHISEIDNIGDVKQFNLLMRYTTYYINVYCKWVFMDFASAGDILSEAFLWMSENGVKEYNAESVIKIIQQTVNRMWPKFLADHPRHSETTEKRNKKVREHNKINLTNGYMVNIIYRKKKYKHLTRAEIKNNPSLIESQRKMIIDKRKKLNRNYEFISHFS